MKTRLHKEPENLLQEECGMIHFHELFGENLNSFGFHKTFFRFTFLPVWLIHLTGCRQVEMILHGNDAHILFGKIKGIFIMHGWQYEESSCWKHMSYRPGFNIVSIACLAVWFWPYASGFLYVNWEWLCFTP